MGQGIGAGLKAMVLAALVLASSAWGSDAEKLAWDEAKKVAVEGPAEVVLLDQAKFKLPAGRVFIGQPQATALLNAMGNPGKDSRLQGLVFPKDDANWFVTVRYEAAGYVKDDDAKDWNADELLQSYKDGTEASNEERAKMNVPALEILGWAEKPHYDSATHRLVWAMSSREKGASDQAEQGVNYNTYALGRDGYFSLNLVTGLSQLEGYKGEAKTL